MKKNAPVKGVLVLMRHGETDHNKQRLMTGQLDVPLNKTGEAQAHAAGLLLRGIRFDKVYSSTLSRAFNTAALALKAAGQDHLPIEQRAEIVEADAGDYTGRNMETDPEVLAFVRLYDSAPPNGESDKQVVAREQPFFDTDVKPRLERGENVLIVMHAGSKRSFDIVIGREKAPADGTARVRRSIPNAGPEKHEYEDGVLVQSTQLVNPVSGHKFKP